jgi:hypothetical protein
MLKPLASLSPVRALSGRAKATPQRGAGAAISAQVSLTQVCVCATRSAGRCAMCYARAAQGTGMVASRLKERHNDAIAAAVALAG